MAGEGYRESKRGEGERENGCGLEELLIGEWTGQRTTERRVRESKVKRARDASAKEALGPCGD